MLSHPSRSIRLVILAFALLPIGCRAATPVSGYTVVAKYPHSTSSYTEGLFYLNGLFYKGTGLAGHSAITVTQPDSGQTIQRLDLPAQYFGEGIVDWGSNLYEWTWKSHICFVYDRFSLRQIKSFTYTGEGWGMTRTATQIITSDGTSKLRFRNPDTFQPTRSITVHDGSSKIDQLNDSSTSRARFTPTSGTRTASRASPPPTATSSVGLTSPAFSPKTSASTPSPS